LAALGAVQPFLAIGVAAIVAGGLAAAVTGPTGWDHGAWIAASIVLTFALGQRRRDVSAVWTAQAYSVLLAVLIVSTPIGLVLPWMRG
jgi:hypothetical protein